MPESTNKKTPCGNIEDNDSFSLIKDNSKKFLKVGEAKYNKGSYIARRNYNNNSIIENSFRKYANHSFVETNYSKNKILKRAYSSSRLYNNNNDIFFNFFQGCL